MSTTTIPAERTVHPAGRPALHLFELGMGEPVVLLHGLGTTAREWRWIWTGLAREHRVLAFDLPGHGRSERGDEAPGALTSAVAAALRELDVPAAAIVGSSMGGQVALHLALEQPDRVRALALLAPSGLGRAIAPPQAASTLPGVTELLRIWTRTPPGALQRALGRTSALFARPSRAPLGWLRDQAALAWADGTLDATLRANRAAVSPGGQREVLLDALPRIAVPTLLVWGGEDRVLPAAQGRAAVERLPNGRLQVLPACGHLPHVERPADVLAVLMPFLTAA